MCGADRDLAVRRYWLVGRLQETRAQEFKGPLGAREVFLAIGGGSRGRAVLVLHGADAARDPAAAALREKYLCRCRHRFHPHQLSRDRGGRHRGEPPRRPRHHAHRAGRGGAGCIRVRRGQREVRDLSRYPLRAGRRRSGSVVRRAGGGGPRLPLVQRLSRTGVHGRHRRACAGRGARRDRGGGAPGDRAVHHGRRVRDGDFVGDAAGRIVQAHGQTHLPHGAAASPLRAQGLARAARDRALLDHHRAAGAGRSRQPQDTVKAMNAAKPNNHSTMIRRDLPNLIVGLGKTGLSCARYLARRGERFALIDSRSNPPELAAVRREFPETEIHLGGFYPMVIFRAERLIVSPGVALSESTIVAAPRRGAGAVGDIELFARAAARAPVIAITGANGKGTVAARVGEKVSDAGRTVRVGGNLGPPALDLLQEGEPDIYVLALSSFQLDGTASLYAGAAAVLYISLDHMDRYRFLEDFDAAMARIYRVDGVMVINADDALVAAMAERGRRVKRFGLSAPTGDDYGVVERTGQLWLARGTRLLMNAAELRIKGMHNIANALASLSLGEAVGLEMDSMLATLRRFPGLPHRTQWVATRDGVTWYNDSKATNVGATLAALQGMPGKVVLIAGGLGKGQDFTPLKEVAAAKARAVVLMGRDAPLIERALADAVPVIHVTSMEEAVQRAAELAQPGDTVLLSPACASFDMFKGYDHRGDAFIAAVRGLPA